ncbi:uncharacterized protein K02A2.6-like [Ahaetulla prasina]|uniref:uncharacterized protein K02A2.6-like n=1 Tax=Ahaetulla prasina TaxID=499056 RepID=UPI002647FBEB|nr:uncharacterized protein K02A2.6-like [Ahaetulla prasina]
MDKEISDRVGKCQACQESRPLPPTAPIREWEKPQGPWSRIHIDFAGPFHGQTFLVVVDAYSKWLEIILMRSTTAESVISVLRHLFVTHGLPDTLVSDNGPQFTATQFEGYLAEEGIRHVLSAPFHPATNGLAERFVRSAKEALSRIRPGDWQTKIDTFLAVQHRTPCVTTGRSPAELLMGRKLRCPFQDAKQESRHRGCGSEVGVVVPATKQLLTAAVVEPTHRCCSVGAFTLWLFEKPSRAFLLDSPVFPREEEKKLFKPSNEPICYCSCYYWANENSVTGIEKFRSEPEKYHL